MQQTLQECSGFGGSLCGRSPKVINREKSGKSIIQTHFMQGEARHDSTVDTRSYLIETIGATRLRKRCEARMEITEGGNAATGDMTARGDAPSL